MPEKDFNALLLKAIMVSSLVFGAITFLWWLLVYRGPFVEALQTGLLFAVSFAIVGLFIVLIKSSTER